MEYYSAIKKNTFESVLMRWMKVEPIIQSEVNQKEKHQYHILRTATVGNHCQILTDLNLTHSKGTGQGRGRNMSTRFFRQALQIR